jgi:hypothetical protein
MILFRRLQYGKRLSLRNISKKRKETCGLHKQVNKGAILESYGNHKEGWRWVCLGTYKDMVLLCVKLILGYKGVFLN